MKAQNPPESFVTVSENKFYKDGKPYFFLGTNFWYGMNLGAHDPDRLVRELDRLKALGLTNLRIMAASEGPDSEPWRMTPSLQPKPGEYNEQLWRGLDLLLSEMAKRDMVAVVCLGNFWPWSGGFAQYIQWAEGEEIPYPPPAEGGDWAVYQLHTANFYRSANAVEWYQDHVKQVVGRKNSVNGRQYNEDPTIMAWQLANEPRGVQNRRSYWKWIKSTAKLIKELDNNHLVTIGSEGKTSSIFSGTRFKKVHAYKHIDYTTIHIWAQNWEWYDPAKPVESYPNALKKAKKYLADHLEIAAKLEKPLVLEEFGISRDWDAHAVNASVEWRNKYYKDMFKLLLKNVEAGVSGANFWAWGGEGRPAKPKAIWKQGHDFIGDPPHEYQGWYSVYDTDDSTLKILKKYAAKFQGIGQ